MDTNDSRQSAFSASRFRDAIGFAMQMGIPGAISERVTFFWEPEKTYTNQDYRSAPYDWTSTPTSTTTAADLPTSLTLPVAVDFFDAKSTSGETVVGDFDIGRVRVTLLDTAYSQLEDVNLGQPNGVKIDGDIYDIDYWAPPVGLFDVTVYTFYASARDES